MADVFDFYVYDDRSIQYAIAEPIMLEDKDVTQFRFRIPKVLNNIDMTSWEWWFIFVNAKKVKYTTQLTLTDDEDDPDNYSNATYTVGYGFSGYVGSVSFSIEALNVSGEDIVNEWHTKTYSTAVIDTLQGIRAVVPEPEGVLSGGSIPVVSNVSDMTNKSSVYLYNGTEIGYTAGHWYFWNTGTSSWTDGGEYTGWETVDTALENFLDENAQEMGVLTVVVGSTTYTYNGSANVSITLPTYNGGVS